MHDCALLWLSPGDFEGDRYEDVLVSSSMMRERLSEKRTNRDPQSFSGQEIAANYQSLFLAAFIFNCILQKRSTLNIWQQ